jgi:hypothetical protein
MFQVSNCRGPLLKRPDILRGVGMLCILEQLFVFVKGEMKTCGHSSAGAPPLRFGGATRTLSPRERYVDYFIRRLIPEIADMKVSAVRNHRISEAFDGRL